MTLDFKTIKINRTITFMWNIIFKGREKIFEGASSCSSRSHTISSEHDRRNIVVWWKNQKVKCTLPHSTLVKHMIFTLNKCFIFYLFFLQPFEFLRAVFIILSNCVTDRSRHSALLYSNSLFNYGLGHQ